ncbi:MAG: DUF6966 domain-containing protein [Frankia sp.]
MQDGEFDDRLARLGAVIDETIELLHDHGESSWRSRVERWRQRLAGYNSVAFDGILSAYGGMGSLNDLVIMVFNGHNIARENEAAVNQHLARLRSTIWSEATELRCALRERHL